MRKVSLLVKAALAGAVMMTASACGVPDQVALGIQDRETPLNDAQAYAVMGAANMGAREMARMAQLKTLNSGVFNYAERQVKDRRTSDQRMDTLASETGVMLPDNTTTSEWFTDSNNVNYMFLGTLPTGERFNRDYLDIMITNHQDLIHVLRDQVIPGVSGDWRAEVERVIIENEGYLTEAQNLRSQM